MQDRASEDEKKTKIKQFLDTEIDFYMKYDIGDGGDLLYDILFETLYAWEKRE